MHFEILPLVFSDVNKDLTLKAKARTKNLTLKAKARTKDSSLKAKDRTKDCNLVLKDNQGPRPRTTSLLVFVVPVMS